MTARGPEAGFDAERAWALLLAQTALGPRFPGSPGHAAMRDWLRGELAARVDEVLLQQFTYADPRAGELALTNIIGVQGRERPRKLLLAAHWDTRPRADNDPDLGRRDTPILGANDGASGVAVLLEIARVLHAQPPRVGIIYAFFDGEDWGFPAPPPSWPPGSAARRRGTSARTASRPTTGAIAIATVRRSGPAVSSTCRVVDGATSAGSQRARR